MTTCTESAQGNLWATGGYVDWAGVHRFLWYQYQQLLVAPGHDIGLQALHLLTSLEMLYGSDVLDSYPAVRGSFPTGERFEDDDLLMLLRWIIEAQWSTSGTLFTQTGDAGWWFSRDLLTGNPDPLHFLPPTADAWIALRRNATGMEQLAGAGIAPLPLEHKVLPGAPYVPEGGGLTSIGPWMETMEEAGAIPGPLNPFGVPQELPNFWGEWVGAVPLFQALSDTANALGQSSSPTWLVPTLQAGNGMGLMLVSAFRYWQQRRNEVQEGTSLPGPVWVATEAQDTDPVVPSLAGWVESGRPSGLFAPSFSATWPVVPGHVPPWADPWAGQDWDAGLHQLTRAIMTMHHLGYGLTTADRLLTVVRLFQWSKRTCENYPAGSCPAGNLATGPSWWGAPRETYRWLDSLICEGEPAPLLSHETQAHDIVDLLTAALAIVRGGLLGAFPPGLLSQGVDAILANCLIAAATLYREDPGVPGAFGWAKEDPGLPAAAAGAPPELSATHFAIALLLLMERGSFAGVANLADLPPGANPAVTLDSFLHIFGGFIPSLLSANPWNPSHVPG